VVADRPGVVLSRGQRADGGRRDNQSHAEGRHARRLFERDYERSVSLYANYSTIDGERFVMIKRTDQGYEPTRINVAVNWFDELRRSTQR